MAPEGAHDCHSRFLLRQGAQHSTWRRAMVYGKLTVLPLAGQAPPLHSAEVISTDMDLYSNLSGPCIGENVNLPGPQRIAPFLEASGLMGTTPSDAAEHAHSSEPVASADIDQHTWVDGLHVFIVLAALAPAPRRAKARVAT